MYNEKQLVRNLASNSYEPEELEVVLRRFRLGWYNQAVKNCALREHDIRKRRRVANERLFDNYFSEVLVWFDDYVHGVKERKSKEKFNYRNYRKPRKYGRQNKQVRRIVPIKQN